MKQHTKTILIMAWTILCPAVTTFQAGAADATGKTFDVRSYGAKGDGKTLDTTAIQQALDECGKAGGGVVRFAEGTYLSKPIHLRNKTELRLDAGATLKATDERADFESTVAGGKALFHAFVNAQNLTDIAITGKGTIDGSGARWWIPAEAARRKKTGYTLPRPRLIVLTACTNVRVTDVTLENSPLFHLVPVRCDNVTIERVTINAPERSPNTDGIDPTQSRRVRISHCRIDVGDDNIAIKCSGPVAGRTSSSEDITVTDCVFLHGHGVSIGSETKGGVRNVTVERCSFTDTDNGIRIKSARDRGGLVENLSYTDITMTNVKPALTITCYYPGIPKEDAAEAVTPDTPIFRNIRIKNLTGDIMPAQMRGSVIRIARRAW